MKYLTTFSTHDNEAEADKALVKAAKLLTSQGKGKTHCAKKQKVRGSYQINIYER